MSIPCLPTEEQRLAVLLRYAILDTPDEKAFDRLTALTARLFQTPIALVTLIDEKRQWIKSAFGTTLRETSRDASFCGHTINDAGLTVVPDTLLDARFQDHPFVTGAPGVRFYAGVPLRVDGAFNLGSLCILDTVPREFSPEQEKLLTDLGAMAVDELELRMAYRENRQLTGAISNLKTGVVVTDPMLPDCPITFANAGFTAMIK